MSISLHVGKYKCLKVLRIDKIMQFFKLALHKKIKNYLQYMYIWQNLKFYIFKNQVLDLLNPGVKKSNLSVR